MKEEKSLVPKKEESIEKLSTIQQLPVWVDQLILMQPEKRELIIHELSEEVKKQFPVVTDKTYKKYRSKRQQKDDFALTHEAVRFDGSENASIAKVGGVSPSYKRNAEIRAAFNHWRSFWDLYEEYERNRELFDMEQGGQLPTWNWHYPHIERYVYHILLESFGIDAMDAYVRALRLQLVRDKDEIIGSNEDGHGERHYENLKSKIIALSEEIKKVKG